MAYKVSLQKVEEAQQDAEARQSRMNASSIKFLKFEGNKMTLRFMPPWTDKEPFAGQFWRVVAQHWGVNEQLSAPILCPKFTPHMGGDCAICDFVSTLRKDKTNPMALETAKDLVAKTSYLFNVVNVDDPTYTVADVAERKKERPDQEIPFKVGDPKIQVYPTPLVVYNQILSIWKAGNEILDLEHGHDIIVSRSGKSGKNKQMRYTSTAILKPSASNVSDNDELPKLEEAGLVFEREKLEELLADGIGGEYEAMANHQKRRTMKALNGGKAAPKQEKEEAEEEEEEADNDNDASDDEDDLAELERLIGDD